MAMNSIASVGATLLVMILAMAISSTIPRVVAVAVGVNASSSLQTDPAPVPVYMNKYMFDNATLMGLTCNDGSPSGFYYRLANVHRWLIHIQGGGWCWDQQSCNDRMKYTPDLMSSNGWPHQWGSFGIFDQNLLLNEWSEASYVYIPYCTSDSFSADTPASNMTYGWSFRGRRILTAIINTLLPMGLATSPSVLLSGCSAGGVAVLANADLVASLLPSLPSRKYRAMCDGGWLLESPAYSPVTATVTDMVRIGHRLWGGKPNAACMAAHTNDYWRCYFGVVVARYITTPVLYHEESQDSAQLVLNGLTGVTTDAELAYLNEWRYNMTIALRTIVSPSAVYAPACLWHCSAELNEFRTIRLSNHGLMTLQDALHWWYTKDGSADNWIDTCDGVRCSINCPTSLAACHTTM